MAKVRGMFALDKEEKLISFYQCSVRAEKNATGDEYAHVGEVAFSQHVCFDLKVFAFHKQLVIESKDIQGLLPEKGPGNVTEMQLKGASYELTIENGFDEACMLLEASRLEAKSAQIVADSGRWTAPTAGRGDGQFTEMLEPIVMEQRDSKHKAVDFDLKEDDWKQFMQCARQRTTRRASMCCARGSRRRRSSRSCAARCAPSCRSRTRRGRRRRPEQAGEMFGETSRQERRRDVDLRRLGGGGHHLPRGGVPRGLSRRRGCGALLLLHRRVRGRRLYQLTQSAADQVAADHLRGAHPVAEILENRALRHLPVPVQAADKAKLSEADPTKDAKIGLASFDLVLQERDFQTLLNAAALMKASTMVVDKFLNAPGSPYLPYDARAQGGLLAAQMDALEKGELNAQARRMLADIAKTAASYVEAHWYEPFLASDHYGYN